MTFKEVFIVVTCIIIYIIGIFANKKFVKDYIVKKFYNYELKSLKWTFSGPIGPGRGNFKYCATMKHKENDEWKELYALSSFFGSVFIHD